MRRFHIVWPSIGKHAGLIYMAIRCMSAGCLAHEMGHFLTGYAAYRVPASLPHFYPFLFMATGTMGAVIHMDGRRADRRQLFDIGLAGPLAGLVLIVPLVCRGILDGHPPAGDEATVQCPQRRAADSFRPTALGSAASAGVAPLRSAG